MHAVVQMAPALQTGSVSLPSTLPWGDRWDSHPLHRGPHPRASASSASTTVRLEGFAPSTSRLSSKHSAAELQAGKSPRGPVELNHPLCTNIVQRSIREPSNIGSRSERGSRRRKELSYRRVAMKCFAAFAARSEWKDLHLRLRAPEARARLSSCTQKCRRGKWI